MEHHGRRPQNSRTCESLDAQLALGVSLSFISRLGVYNMRSHSIVVLLLVCTAGCSSAPPAEDTTKSQFAGWKLHWCTLGSVEKARSGALPEWTNNPGSYVLYSRVKGDWTMVRAASKLDGDSLESPRYNPGVLYVSPGAREACIIGDTMNINGEQMDKVPSDIPLDGDTVSYVCPPMLVNSFIGTTPCNYPLLKRGRRGNVSLDLADVRAVISAALPSIEKEIAAAADTENRRLANEQEHRRQEQEKQAAVAARKAALKAGRTRMMSFSDATLLLEPKGTLMDTAQLVLSPLLNPDNRNYAGFGFAENRLDAKTISCRFGMSGMFSPEDPRINSRFLLVLDNDTAYFGDSFRLNSPFQFIARYVANQDVETVQGQRLTVIRLKALAIDTSFGQ